MFEVGFTEIILILGLALLVLGPERLPELAAKVGRWTGRARAMARQFQSQLEQEVTLDSVTKNNAQYSAPPEPEPSPDASVAVEPLGNELAPTQHGGTAPSDDAVPTKQ